MTSGRGQKIFIAMIQSNLQHECQTRATQVRHERHKCNTSETRVTRVRHECCTNDASATRVKNFDFDNGTSKNIFSHPYIYYMESERLFYKESNNFILRTTFRGDQHTWLVGSLVIQGWQSMRIQVHRFLISNSCKKPKIKSTSK